MKSRVGTLVALLFGAILTFAQAEDIKTVTGKEYKNVKISRAEPDGLVIIASYGIIKISFEELPADLQQKYHYDPVASAQFRQRLDDAATKRARQIAEVEKQKQLEQAAAIAVSTATSDTTVAPVQPALTQPEPIRQPMQETSALSRGAYAKTATAEQIFFDYVSNAIAADARYKGQRYSLGGTIDSITSKDGVGIVEIEVPFYGTKRAFWETMRSARESTHLYFMRAYFPDPSVLVPYRVGGAIGFKGSIEGFHGHILTVRDCCLPR